uniref:Uncharacterized protein n=1 Tax=Guillardia theta (strain CCMP2712) TaxID=905079 RepID=A0A0C3SPT1_GUITC
MLREEQPDNFGIPGTQSLRKGSISHLLGMLDGPGMMFYQSGMAADLNMFRSTNSVHKGQLEDRRYTGSIHSWWDGRRSVRGKNTGRER